MTTKSELLLQEKPVKILLTIRENDKPYTSEISKKVDTTFAHTVKVVGKLEDIGLIEKQQNGRKKNIRLTQEGKRLAEVLQPVVDQMEEFEITGGRLAGQY